MTDHDDTNEPKLKRLVRITPSLRVLQFLCDNMRPDEVRQWLEFTGWDEYDPDRAAMAFMQKIEANNMGFAFAEPTPAGGLAPVIAGGYELIIPGVWQSWMVGTMGGWERNWRDIHRGTLWYVENMIDRGARRLQITALADRTEARAWYEKLGFTYEGTMAGFGMSGVDAVLYGMKHGGE